MDADIEREGENRCPHCPRRFVRHGNLVQHLMNQHQEEMGLTAEAPSVEPPTLPAVPPASREAGGTPATPMSFSFSRQHVDGRDSVLCNGAQPECQDGAALASTCSTTPSNAQAVPVLGTTAEKVRSYYAAFGDMQRTRLLVPSSSTQLSAFDTSELKDMRLFALSAGGSGLSQKARAEYYQTTVRAERAALRAQRDAEVAALGRVLEELTEDQGSDSDGDTPTGGCSAAPVAAGPHFSAATANSSAGQAPARRPKKTSLRKRIKAAVLAAQAELEAAVGPLETAFPTETSFVNSLKGATSRCLAEQGWRVSDIVDGDDVYKFYSREVMLAAFNAFKRATSRCMRGQRKFAADGSVLRSGSLDSDLYLREQDDVNRMHAGRFLNGKPLKVFTVATQFFSDATMVSKNGGKCAYHVFC